MSSLQSPAWPPISAEIFLNFSNFALPHEGIREELLRIRPLLARTVGRRQYLYGVVDRALECGDPEAMRRARQELEQVRRAGW